MSVINSITAYGQIQYVRPAFQWEGGLEWNQMQLFWDGDKLPEEFSLREGIYTFSERMIGTNRSSETWKWRWFARIIQIIARQFVDSEQDRAALHDSVELSSYTSGRQCATFADAYAHVLPLLDKILPKIRYQWNNSDKRTRREFREMFEEQYKLFLIASKNGVLELN